MKKNLMRKSVSYTHLDVYKRQEESDAKEFIIGTENSIVQHLQYECPDKKFYPLSKDCVCHNMKLTTLMDVYNCVCGQAVSYTHLVCDESYLLPCRAFVKHVLGRVNGGKQMTSILIIAVGGGVQPNRAYSTGCRFFIDKSIIGAECVSAPLDT